MIPEENRHGTPAHMCMVVLSPCVEGSMLPIRPFWNEATRKDFETAPGYGQMFRDISERCYSHRLVQYCARHEQFANSSWRLTGIPSEEMSGRLSNGPASSTLTSTVWVSASLTEGLGAGSAPGASTSIAKSEKANLLG